MLVPVKPPDSGGSSASAETAPTIADAGSAATLTSDGAPPSSSSPSSPSSGAAWDGEAAVPPMAAQDRYRLAGEVGHGGLGRIFRAEDQWLGRTVALKELRTKRKHWTQRFRREALLTARLEHPGIVPVHDAGHWANGVPFYSMKLVSGDSLDAAIKRARTFADRLALVPRVRAVADAMAYAHSERIIHRDLKPANVMLGAFGETVVIDWGLAKHLDAAPEDDTIDGAASGYGDVGEGLTTTGSVLGTPAYMSPEQARGEPVDERTDVYALGGMLYAVLTGMAPYRGTESAGVLASVLDGPPPPLRERVPEVPPELAAIVDKAMARDAAGRYRSAAELADDLNRFETGQLVGAHAYSVGALLLRWIGRHRAAVAVGVAAVVALGGFGVVSVQRIVRARAAAEEQRARAQTARGEAERERARAEDWSANVTLLQARSALADDPTAALAWLRHVSVTPARAGDVRELAHSALAAGAAELVLLRDDRSSVWRVAFSPDETQLAVPWPSGASLLLRDLRTGASRVLRGDAGALESFAFFPDGRDVVGVTADGEVIAWDVASGAARVLGRHADRASQIAIAPDGSWVATAGSEPTVRMWTRAGEPVRELVASEGVVWGVVVSPEGRTLATAGGDGTVRLFDAATGEGRVLGKHRGDAYTVAFSPDGASLASVGVDGELRLWSVATGAVRVLRGHTGPSFVVAWSPDGARVATTGNDMTVRVWDVATGKGRALTGHTMETFIAEFTPGGGDALVSTSFDGTVRVWDVTTGDARVLRGHPGSVQALAIARDGRIATGDGFGWIRLWKPLPSAGRLAVSPGRVRELKVSGDGALAVTASANGAIAAVDLATGAGRVLGNHEAGAWDVEVLPDGSVISGGEDRAVRVWSGDGARSRVLARIDKPVRYVRADPSGAWVAVVSTEGDGALYPIAGGAPRALGEGAVWSVRFTPGGDAAVYGTASGAVIVEPLDGGAPRRLEGLTAQVYELAVSPDGAYVAARAGDGELALWRAADGQRVPVDAACHEYAPMAFSPDGRRFAIALPDHALRVVDLPSGTERVLRGHRGTVRCLAFAPSGAHLASCSQDEALRVWNIDAGTSRVLSADRVGVGVAAFSGDGSQLVTGADSGEVRVWSDLYADPVPIEPGALARWVEDATTAEVAPNGPVQTPSSRIAGP